MNNVQKKYRISDRKFIDNEIEKGCKESADMIIGKEATGEYKKLLESANIPYDGISRYWIRTNCDMLNLYNAMDILDGCDRRIYKKYDDSGKYMIKSTPMSDGTHKITIHYLPDTENELYVSTDFANDELSFEYQMAYDIYSGCPRFEWSTDIDNHIKNAIKIINAAKNGEVFRRDIFSCESYGTVFVPVDVINIKVTIDKTIKDIPYITGCLMMPNRIIPYALKASMAKVSQRYLNEELILPGEHISLSGMNNLFIQIIEDKKDIDDANAIIKAALNLLLNAKTRHEPLESIQHTLTKYVCTENDPDLGYIDDYNRRNAKPLEVSPQLLKYTKYQTTI